jgi:hypothetical protein
MARSTRSTSYWYDQPVRLPYQAPPDQARHYVFLRPCGCPEGVTDASPTRPGGPPRLADENAAWTDMYTRAEERDARRRGITVVHVDHATYERDYYPLMPAWTCGHR